MTEIERQAQLTASRIDPQEMRFDPVTILTILTTVLPLVADCFNRNDEPDPVATKKRAAEYYRRNPKGMRRRTARRVRAEADQPMTREQSFKFADAIIAQTLSSDDIVVELCCREAAGMALTPKGDDNEES